MVSWEERSKNRERIDIYICYLICVTKKEFVGLDFEEPTLFLIKKENNLPFFK